MSDAHFGHRKDKTDTFCNSGFMFYRAGELQIMFVQRVIDLLASRPDKMDQDAVLTALTNWNGPPLPLYIFPPHIVQNGWQFFVRRVGAAAGELPIVVHNNWADGDKGTHIQKVYRFQETGLWTQSPPSHFLPASRAPGAPPVFSLSFPTGTHITRQLHSIAGLLRLSRMHGHVAVLPPLVCGGEGVWCLADAMLDMSKLLELNNMWKSPGSSGHGQELASGVRESSYTENPDTHDDVRTRVGFVVATQAAADEMLATHGNDVPVAVLGEEPTERNIAQALRALQESSKVPLRRVHFHLDLSPFVPAVSAPSPLQNTIADLFIRKDLLKAVQPTFYITEAAKRIRYHHIQTHCFAVAPPSSLLNNPKALASILAQLPAFARSTSGLEYDCVFIALLSSGKRSATEVQGLFDANRVGAIKRVFTLSEGVFPYPLDDLWAMRTHAMVAMVELHVMAHLKDVLVWPNAGDSPYAEDDLLYVREMLRLKGVYAPGRVHTVTTGKAGKSVIRVDKAELLPCAAPKWQDFRMAFDMASHTDQLGLKGIAEACYLDAVSYKPAEAASIYNSLALLYSEMERNADAIAAYNSSLQIEENVALYVNMGVQLQRVGRSLEAADAYVKSIAMKPYVEAYHNLAGVYSELGRYNDAIVSFNKAIEMRPNFAVSYLGLGRCYHRLRRMDEAEAALKKGIELDPSASSSYLDLGQLYSEQALYDKEIALYERLLARDPSVAVAHSYLATAIVAKYQVEIGYRSMGKEPEKDNVVIDKAMALFDRSIELDPTCGMCHGQRADLLKDAHRIGEAIAGYHKSYLLSPDSPTIFCNYMYTKFFACDWSDYRSDFDRLTSLLIQETTAPSLPMHQCVLPLMAVLYRPLNASHLLAATRLFVDRTCAGIQPLPPLPPTSAIAGERRVLRLGYITADFKDHPVAKRMQQVYGLHDRSRVFATAFSLNEDDHSPWRKKIVESIERFLDMTGLFYRGGELAVAQRIQEERIDVLINLAGHTRANDMVTKICAYRPAPVQMLHLGYAGSMGRSLVDLHVTDRYSSPVEYRRHYDEALFYMPGSFFVNDYMFTYSNIASYVPTDQERLELLQRGGLPPMPFVYSSFNQLYKTDPGIFKIWMKGLSEISHAALWLIEIHTTETQGVFRREAEAVGVSGSRIHFTRGYSEEEHLLIKGAADVFLDTPSYNAHSTGTDALWAGIPMLTLPETKMGSRVAAGLCHAVESPHLIARNEEDYLQLMIAVGRRPQILRRIKDQLGLTKAKSRLFDTPQWVADEEAGMRMAVDAQTFTGKSSYHMIISGERPSPSGS